LTVAIAYDEAFNCYYPDSLDLLELRGASVVDFSPLRDENLPPQVDVVYFGCGHPERFAAALSENHCMAAALRSHLCAGRRIYGEGGGAAYLCHQMETPAGDLKRMAGVLPAVARFERNPSPVRPMEITLARSNWLGDQGTRLRGYRSSFWRFEPAGDLVGFAGEREHDFDMIGNFRAVGSLLHLHFAAQPKCLDRFFVPGIPQSDLFPPLSLPALRDTPGW
jgi:cobyrinic acid a,c-diamide synthase